MDKKLELSLISKRLYDKGLSPGFSGNASVRDGETVLVTPSGVSLDNVNIENIVRVDFDGNKLEGDLKPTSEVFMHLKTYKNRADVGAIIHCHAPKSSAFAVSGVSLSAPFLAENIVHFGDIPFVDYFMPSSKELADGVSNALKTCDVALMRNHGVIAVADNLQNAFYKIDTIEYSCEVYLNAKILGNINLLNEKQVSELIELRKRMKS